MTSQDTEMGPTRGIWRRFRAKRPVNESVEEAKHPGALLGLIMGSYPLLLVVFILIALAYSLLFRPLFSGSRDVALPAVTTSSGDVNP